MPTPVVMPQMGESIAEGTIVRWIKKVGDTVDRDEPLFEISTDKVDAEIPSPAAGVLTEIKVKEGETVPVNAVVAAIGEPGEQPAAAAAPATGSPAPAPAAPARETPSAAFPRPPARSGAGKTNGSAQASAPAATVDDLRRQKSSPLVRRIAREHNVDISGLHGSGTGGRVTKADILGFLESSAGQAADAPAAPSQVPIAEPVLQRPSGDRVDIRPMSVMRKKIAEHMVMSRRTSAHVHTVFNVNFSTIERIRRQKQADYERLGTKLTFMPFIAKAVVDALRAHPEFNASIDGDNIVYHKDVHLGIAVSLDTGLIVPVIRNADEKNVLGLTRAITDLASRARNKQLKPEEVQGGTFTITNPGQSGAQFGLPIINQPQVAILGIGAIEPRPVVIDDAIAIRTMSYLSLGFDHRLLDGAVANEFMAEIQRQLEQFDASQV